jgi:ATP-binding protein involved in chromosome partitioning
MLKNEKPTSVTVDGRSKMKPVESYEVKNSIYWFYSTKSSCNLRGPMASKALNQMIFWRLSGELDFMLVGFASRNRRYPLVY